MKFNPALWLVLGIVLSTLYLVIARLRRESREDTRKYEEKWVKDYTLLVCPECTSSDVKVVELMPNILEMTGNHSQITRLRCLLCGAVRTTWHWVDYCKKPYEIPVLSIQKYRGRFYVIKKHLSEKQTAILADENAGDGIEKSRILSNQLFPKDARGYDVSAKESA